VTIIGNVTVTLMLGLQWTSC